MRPQSLAQVHGQSAALRPGSPLRRLIEGPSGAGPAAGGPAIGPQSAILWGPPGTGKTTLAHLVAAAGGRRFVELSAVTAGVKDVRTVIEGAVADLGLYRRDYRSLPR
jgi:putative ATPase